MQSGRDTEELVESLPCILMACFIPGANFAGKIYCTDDEKGKVHIHTLGNESCFSVFVLMSWFKSALSAYLCTHLTIGNYATFAVLYFWLVRHSGLNKL